eukprot:2545111-Ditylum_brightwellii.AAC.1
MRVDASYWIEGLENFDWNWMWIQSVVIDWIGMYTPGSEEYQVLFQNCHWVGGVPHVVSVMDWFHNKDMIQVADAGA